LSDDIISIKSILTQGRLMGDFWVGIFWVVFKIGDALAVQAGCSGERKGISFLSRGLTLNGISDLTGP
jgi:hypothetical protein